MGQVEDLEIEILESGRLAPGTQVDACVILLIARLQHPGRDFDQTWPIECRHF